MHGNKAEIRISQKELQSSGLATSLRDADHKTPPEAILSPAEGRLVSEWSGLLKRSDMPELAREKS
jgi:hypothetical protein